MLMCLLVSGCPEQASEPDARIDAHVEGTDAPGADVEAPMDARLDAGEVADAPGGDAPASIEEPPLTADEAARFMAVATACPVGRSVSALNDDTLAGMIELSEEDADFARMARCVGAAGSNCVGLTACGFPVGVRGGTCTSMHCEGDSLHMCSGTPGTPGSLVTIDCAAIGLSCVETDADAFGCGEPCTASACDADGSGGLFCASGVGRRIDCRSGYRCATGAFGRLECVGDVAACTVSSCVGSTFVECDTGGRSRPPVDCTDGGGTCTTSGCVPAATECVPGAAPPSCVGTAIRYCSPGHTIEMLDCALMGFTSCLATGGAAYCRP